MGGWGPVAGGKQEAPASEITQLCWHASHTSFLKDVSSFSQNDPQWTNGFMAFAFLVHSKVLYNQAFGIYAPVTSHY